MTYPNLRSGIVACSIAMLLAGCASVTADWEIEETEQLYANGELELALRQAERLVQRDYLHPNDRIIALQIAALRDLGRTQAADAFLEYTQRYAAGSPPHVAASAHSTRDCSRGQPGYELISVWGDSEHIRSHGNYAIGTIAATFDVDSDGQIGNIEVLRAEHPAAAWLLINSVSGAGVSEVQLNDRRNKEPEAFPFRLCAWWNFGRQTDGLDQWRVPSSR